MTDKKFFENVADVAARQITAGGRSVKVAYQFENIAAEVCAGPKGRMSPENRPNLHRLTKDNCFYLTIRNEAGELDGFCAAHLFDAGAQSFPAFLSGLYARLYGGGRPAIFEEDMPPVADEMAGRLVYFGDFFLRQGAKGRNGVDPVAMSAYFFATVARKWNADWIFGFAKDRNIKRGLAAKYMAARLYPGAIRWRVEGENRFDQDWLLCSDRRDYAFALSRWVSEQTQAQRTSSPSSLPPLSARAAEGAHM